MPDFHPGEGKQLAADGDEAGGGFGSEPARVARGLTKHRLRWGTF